MRRDIPFIGALIFAALTALATRVSGALAAAYKTHVFPPVSAALRRLSESPPGAVVMAVGLSMAAAVCLYSGSVRRCAARALCVCLVPCWLLWTPLYNVPALPDAPLSGDALYRLCLKLNAEADALLPLAKDMTADGMMAEAERLTGALTGESLTLSRRDVTTLFDHIGLAGFYNPLTGTAHISLNDQTYMLPFTMCHELAHQAGYAREDEANYIAYKACMSGDAAFRFSGCFNMLLYAMDMLYETDRPAWRQCVNGMSDPLFSRFARCNGLYAAQETLAYRLSQTLSTLLLRMNGQTQSYEDVIRLLLAENASSPDARNTHQGLMNIFVYSAAGTVGTNSIRPQLSHSTIWPPFRRPSTAAGSVILQPPQRSPLILAIGGMACCLIWR